MKPDFEKHLIGIYRTLKTKLDYVNNSIGHNLTQGEENEIIINQLLSDFLPHGKYYLSSGVILGIDGSTSKQNDIVVLDNTQPNYTLSRDSKIHLADHVVAAIEVKTRFTRKSLRQGLANISAVKALKVRERSWSQLNTFYPTDSERNFEFVNLKATPPQGILFFYAIPEKKSAHNIDQYFQVLESELSKIPWHRRPDLIFNLGNATRYRSNYPRTEEAEEYGVTLLMDSDNSKIALKLEGDAITKKTLQLMNFRKSDLKVHEYVDATGIQDSRKRSNIIAVVDDDLNTDPLTYPSCTIKDTVYFIDIYRGFIQFIELVNNLFSISGSNPYWNITDYLGTKYLKGVGYDKERGIE